MKRAAILLALAALAGCGEEPPIDPAVRAATFQWDTTVKERDKRWILEAVDQARPEARRLIDDVDGMIVMGTYAQPGSPEVGLMRATGEHRYQVVFNLAYLNGERRIDRTTTVLHELGHVVDHAVVPPELRDELAAQLPELGGCVTPVHGDCTAPEERFADTFAKWALRGAVSAAGAGYGVASPASLEDWGTPLATLAIKIQVAGRRT
jgi:predicted small lipoprotein YifL